MNKWTRFWADHGLESTPVNGFMQPASDIDGERLKRYYPG